MRTIVLVLVALALLTTGCKDRWETEDPEEALKLFVSAIYYNNSGAAWHFLTEDAKADLKARAERLNASVEGEGVEPHRLLVSSGFIGTKHITKIAQDKAASQSDTTTTLLLTTHGGGEHRVNMTRVDGIWRVNLDRWPKL